MNGDFSFTISIPDLAIEHLQVLYGARPCSGCTTLIAAVRLVADLDAEEPETLGFQWSEFTATDFGREHTPQRCQALRSGHGP